MREYSPVHLRCQIVEFLLLAKKNQNSDRNACVTSTAEMVLLTVARLTAGALFPSITFCMLSKCYASRYTLHHSWLSHIVDFEPTHKLHTCTWCWVRVVVD